SMPRPDGTIAPEQRPEADINVEFLSTTRFAAESMSLAFFFRDANERYATDYPAAVGNHMTNTDSSVFMNLVPSISLRENERGMQNGAGWNTPWPCAHRFCACARQVRLMVGSGADVAVQCFGHRSI